MACATSSAVLIGCEKVRFETWSTSDMINPVSIGPGDTIRMTIDSLAIESNANNMPVRAATLVDHFQPVEELGLCEFLTRDGLAAGSGEKTVCFDGATHGKACSEDADCGNDGTCGGAAYRWTGGVVAGSPKSGQYAFVGDPRPLGYSAITSAAGDYVALPPSGIENMYGGQSCFSCS